MTKCSDERSLWFRRRASSLRSDRRQRVPAASNGARRRRERGAAPERRREARGGRGEVPRRRPHPAPQPPTAPQPACPACRSCRGAAAAALPDLPRSEEESSEYELFGATLGRPEALLRGAEGSAESGLSRRPPEAPGAACLGRSHGEIPALLHDGVLHDGRAEGAAEDQPGDRAAAQEGQARREEGAQAPPAR